MKYYKCSLRVYDFEFTLLRKGIKPVDIDFVGITIYRLNICRNPYYKGFKFMK